MYVSNVSRDDREQLPLIYLVISCLKGHVGPLDGPMERDRITRLGANTKKRTDKKLEAEFLQKIILFGWKRLFKDR